MILAGRLAPMWSEIQARSSACSVSVKSNEDSRTLHTKTWSSLKGGMVSVNCPQPAIKKIEVLCTNNGQAEDDLHSPSYAFLMLFFAAAKVGARPGLYSQGC